MAIRKYNIKAELMALASVANNLSEEHSFRYLGMLKPEHFGSPTTLEIFKRISRIVQDGKRIPSFETLADDPRLSSAARQLVAQARNACHRDETDFKQGIETLSTHFKARQLLELNAKIAEILNGDDLSEGFDEVQSDIENTLFKMRAENVAEKIYTGGAGSTEILDIAKRVLSKNRVRKQFKTGFGEFDDLTGGLEPGNVMLITANTGGGKSVAALSMMSNMFRGHGHHVSYVSLEMNENEVIERLISNTTGVEHQKIRNQCLTDEGRKTAFNDFARFNRSSGGSYRLWCPKSDVTIEEVISQVQSAKTEVIILDYLGLLKSGSYGKNATEEFQLRQMTRYAKRAADRMGCAIVLLAQLNDEGQIMYSKGIGHHVHYWLKWFCRDEDIKRGFVTVENGKSRNSARKDFYFTVDFARMRMECVAHPPGLEESRQESRPQGQGKQQQGGRQRPGHQQRPARPPQPTSIAINLFDSVQ
jgi:replicative DNA helicase